MSVTKLEFKSLIAARLLTYLCISSWRTKRKLRNFPCQIDCINFRLKNCLCIELSKRRQKIHKNQLLSLIYPLKNCSRIIPQNRLSRSFLPRWNSSFKVLFSNQSIQPNSNRSSLSRPYSIQHVHASTLSTLSHVGRT